MKKLLETQLNEFYRQHWLTSIFLNGLFTYYVLKGLGGDADDNQDKKLTIGELGKYVQVKVKEQAAIEGREQIPELQGDTEKVLVQW